MAPPTSPDTGSPSTPARTLLEQARAQWRRADRYVRSQLTWNRVFRATSYARSALWIVPFVAILLVLMFAPALRWLDTWLSWRLAGLGVSGAEALYQTVITLSLSFMVFTFGSLLVAIQVAGGQMTPRIIATTLLRDNVVRYSVGLFVFTLVFAVMALDRLEDRVHELVAFVAACLGITCMAAFLFLIDYAARLLRPVAVLARVADEGQAVIQSVYPHATGSATDEADSTEPLTEARQRTVVHAGPSEIVVALDLASLVREARWTDGVIEFVPQVGDFIERGEPLFVLYGGSTTVDDRILQNAVALGPERTMEQDPLFSFRILVDIALKALSPAINDPTTAVLVLDQLQRLLRQVGRRKLRAEAIVDVSGRRRVICRTPNWEDFVHVSCHEIRMCGASNIQVARRMRAMLDDLVATLPAHRHPALDQERARLDLSIAAQYSIPDDLALAREPDSQGLGGSPGSRAPGARRPPVR
jgi:uncharacterized membrane protein